MRKRAKPRGPAMYRQFFDGHEALVPLADVKVRGPNEIVGPTSRFRYSLYLRIEVFWDHEVP
jgi:hypothetical protein